MLNMVCKAKEKLVKLCYLLGIRNNSTYNMINVREYSAFVMPLVEQLLGFGAKILIPLFQLTAFWPLNHIQRQQKIIAKLYVCLKTDKYIYKNIVWFFCSLPKASPWEWNWKQIENENNKHGVESGYWRKMRVNA